MRIALMVAVGFSLSAYARGGGGGHGGGGHSGGGGSHGGGGFHGGGSGGFHGGGGHHFDTGGRTFNTHPTFGFTAPGARGVPSPRPGHIHYGGGYSNRGYYSYPGYGYGYGGYYVSPYVTAYPYDSYGTTEYYDDAEYPPPQSQQGQGGIYVDPNHPDEGDPVGESESGQNDEPLGQGQVFEVSPSAPQGSAPPQVAPQAPQKLAPQVQQPGPRTQQQAAPAQPTHDPDVYHWVDEDGVDHYSTNLPPEARGKATKMGYDGSLVSWTPVTKSEAEAATKQQK